MRHHKKKELDLWRFVEQTLSANHRCMLLMVVDHKGSSPGRAGFKMAVTSSGQLVGSIGGGVMEYKLVELSKRSLSSQPSLVQLIHQVHRAESSGNRSGMICSGDQRVAMIPLDADSLELIKAISLEFERNGRRLLELSPGGLSLSEDDGNRGFQQQDRDNWKYLEPIIRQFDLHIVGGGHISLALSKLAVELGFGVHVYDHRKDLHTVDHNNYADTISRVEYSNLKQLIPGGIMHLVVIMTVGYRTDLEALKAIIDGNYGYLGLLGSKAKIEQLLKELRAQGYLEQQLMAIDAPAGIEIGSQTPAEIAVSIGARLIRARHQHLVKPGSL